MRVRLKLDIYLEDKTVLEHGREFDAVLNSSGFHRGLYTIEVDGRPIDLRPSEVELCQVRRSPSGK